MSEQITFEEQLRRDGVLVFPNKGVSMLPLLRQGRDLMVIEKKNAPCRKYDAVLFLRPRASGGHDYVMHRILRRNPDGTFWVLGDNCVTGDAVREEQIIGVLTAVIRDGRRISADSLAYRLYVRLWCAPYRLRIAVCRVWRFAARIAKRLLP